MRRHPTDLLSLLPGLVFVAVAATALAGGIDFELRLELDWVWPALLLAVGLALLAGLGRTPPPDGSGPDASG
jgi:hypothetical protein